MTENEKIAQIKWLMEKHSVISKDKDFTEPLKDAIQALKEIQQYRALEQKLQSVYGEHDGLLEIVINGLAKFDNAPDKAIKAVLLTDEDVEKWEQYKAIGTVEEIQQKDEVIATQRDIIDGVYKDYEKYLKIGTIEEFKALKEKSVAKKAKWHPNPCAEDNRIPICPNCNTIMVRTEIFGRTIDEHCVSCGQAIDWSE